MSSINAFSSIASDVLCIFERILNFFQSVGIIHAYTFSYSDVFFSPVADKYLENFITLLEEVKDVLHKLQEVKNQPKPVEGNTGNPNRTLASSDLISASQLIQSAETYVTEDLMVQHDELGQFITPQSILNNSEINEPATESPWVAQEEKETEEEKENDKFHCSVCNKILSSKTALKQHIVTHTGQKLFCCEHCGKLFTTNLNLSAHMTRQHNLNTESADSCNECGKLFVRKSALETHIKSHLSIKPWACSICPKTFTQKVTRDIHQLTHTRDYRFCCDTCGKRFPSKAKLNYHSKTHGEPQFNCHVCDKHFTTRQYLMAHYRTHDLRQPPPQAPCRLDTVNTQAVEKASFSCSHCGRTFPSQHNLNLHSQKHNRYNMDKRKMAPRQKHGCNVCGKEFLLKASLAHHQRQQHPAPGQQLRPYSCQLCNQTFTLQAKARLHMKIHTQDILQVQHSCAVCGRMFLRKDSLQRHLTLHNRGVNKTSVRLSVPTYKCQQCDKSYRSKVALNFHTQTHEGKFKYQCNVCGKKFVRSCHYQGHLLSHSTDRPYKCDTCGKGFKDNKTCREHSKRVHTHSTVTQPLPHNTDGLNLPHHTTIKDLGSTGGAKPDDSHVTAAQSVPSYQKDQALVAQFSTTDVERTTWVRKFKEKKSSLNSLRGETTSVQHLSASELLSIRNEMAATQMQIQTLLAGDDATYGQTYDQFQACVQLQ